MDNEQPEIILPVTNLDNSRAFYRNILGFGNPVFDSNFKVEFQLTPHLKLALKKNTAAGKHEKPPEWRYKTDDPETLAATLRSYGFPVEKIAENIFRAFDPENNPFLLLVCPDAVLPEK